MRNKVGNRLAPSMAIENRLYDETRPVVSAMLEQTDRALRTETLYETKARVSEVFKKHTRRITHDFINRVINYTRLAFKNVTKGFDVDVRDNLESRSTVRRIEKRWAECESLLNDIPVLFYKKLDVAIRSLSSGTLSRDMFAERYGELKRQVYVRLRIIASTQNARATEALLVSRCMESGVTTVMWKHTHLPEQKPRDYHLQKWDGHSGKRNGKPNGLNGYVFDIRNPPVIDKKTGERGFPAQLINCKCFLVPVDSSRTPLRRK